MGDLSFIPGLGRSPGPNPHWESLRRVKKDISGKRNYIMEKKIWYIQNVAQCLDCMEAVSGMQQGNLR